MQCNDLSIHVRDRVGRACVAIAWLSDRAGIDQIFRILLQDGLKLRIALWRVDFEPPLRIYLSAKSDVRVAEEAEWPPGNRNRTCGIEICHDVQILIERRAVTDLDAFIDDHRSDWELAQILEGGFRERFSRPASGRSRDRIEVFGVIEAGRYLIVIAAHRGHRLQRLHAIDDSVGIGAVAYEISEHEHRIVFLRSGRQEHRFECFEVAVNVAENQVTHAIRAAR